MDPSDATRQRDDATEEALSTFRERIMYSLGATGVLVLTPFAINNFIQGRVLLGSLVLAAALILGIDALAIHRQRQPPLPFELLLIPMVGGIALSLQTQGFYGALWAYPSVLLFHFVLSRRAANVCSAVLLLVVSALAWHFTGSAVTIRFFATLLVNIAFINISLSIIGDLQRRLLDQAIRDPLTGAFNRRHMTASLDDAIERFRRTGATSSILLLDVDHFKRINDELGHAAGDRVLIGVVALIGERTRRLDKLFRIGGEEFILLMPDTHEADAAAVAEQLRGAIAAAALLDERPVTTSIGVGELAEGDTRDSCIKRADEALYRAKDAGRNRVERASGAPAPERADAATAGA